MSGCEACGKPKETKISRACRPCLATFHAWTRITGDGFSIWLNSVQHKFSNVQNSGGLTSILIAAAVPTTVCGCGALAYGASCADCASNSGTCEACGNNERKWPHRICESCYDKWRVIQQRSATSRQHFNQFLADRGTLMAGSDTVTGAAKCECGSDAVGGGTHSRWCPKGGGR